jgi:hypothetical protein
LESTNRPFGSCAFVTLTYSDELLPADHSVNRDDPQRFLKRLRYYLDHPFRYYLASEYGERLARPHYHALLFGVPYESWPLIDKAWGLGYVQTGLLGDGAITYVAAYAAKGVVNNGRPRSDGRAHEFHLFSRRPGIGLGSVPEFGKSLLRHDGAELRASLEKFGDVPPAFRVNGRLHYFGREFRRQLRVWLGRPPESPPTARHRRELERVALADSVGVPELVLRESGEARGASLRAESLSAIRRSRRSL